MSVMLLGKSLNFPKWLVMELKILCQSGAYNFDSHEALYKISF